MVQKQWKHLHNPHTVAPVQNVLWQVSNLNCKSSGFVSSPLRIEYVTITPDGFRYRSQIFPTVNGLFRWFKDHYQEPVPGIVAVPLQFSMCTVETYCR